MPKTESTLRVLDYLKSEPPSSADIAETAKKKKKKRKKKLEAESEAAKAPTDITGPY